MAQILSWPVAHAQKIGPVPAGAGDRVKATFDKLDQILPFQANPSAMTVTGGLPFHSR